MIEKDAVYRIIDEIVLDVDVPTDIQEFGRRHKIPNFTSAAYKAAFVECAKIIRRRVIDHED